MFILICSMLNETLSTDHKVIFSGISLMLFSMVEFFTLLGNLVILQMCAID